jgi:hypothetical protein
MDRVTPRPIFQTKSLLGVYSSEMRPTTDQIVPSVVTFTTPWVVKLKELLRPDCKGDSPLTPGASGPGGSVEGLVGGTHGYVEFPRYDTGPSPRFPLATGLPVKVMGDPPGSSAVSVSSFQTLSF